LLALELLSTATCNNIEILTYTHPPLIKQLSWILLFTAPIGCVIGLYVHLYKSNLFLNSIKIITEDGPGLFISFYAAIVIPTTIIAFLSVVTTSIILVLSICKQIHSSMQKNSFKSQRQLIGQAFLLTAVLSIITCSLFLTKSQETGSNIYIQYFNETILNGYSSDSNINIPSIGKSFDATGLNVDLNCQECNVGGQECDLIVCNIVISVVQPFNSTSEYGTNCHDVNFTRIGTETCNGSVEIINDYLTELIDLNFVCTYLGSCY
jgi:hypothetical protein